MQKWVFDRLKDEKWLADARQKLVADGLPEATVKNYPPEQVMFQKLWAKYEAARDNLTKWLVFPYWQAEPELLKIQEPIEPRTLWFPDPNAKDEDAIVKSFTTGLQVKRAMPPSDQRIALLQVVEALLVHAAENDGKLPASLQDIKLPLSVDPDIRKAVCV